MGRSPTSGFIPRPTFAGRNRLVESLKQNIAGNGDMTSRLIEAVLRCDIEAMKVAIAAGADPNEIDDGMTPLLWAILGGHFDAVKLLLENGAVPNVHPNPSDSPLWS